MWTDGQTDMEKLIVAFCSFVNTKVFVVHNMHVMNVKLT
jgi:hypothetical protein